MNTYYANQINFSIDGITSLTIYERLNLWQEVANLSLDRRILLENMFSFTDVVVPNGSVDVENGYVNINNPETIRRIETAMQMPTIGQFSPEDVVFGMHSGMFVFQSLYLAPSIFTTTHLRPI